MFALKPSLQITRRHLVLKPAVKWEQLLDNSFLRRREPSSVCHGNDPEQLQMLPTGLFVVPAYAPGMSNDEGK